MSVKSVTYNFTSRKRAFGNQWLIYSNKSQSILSLLSDREVAHWVLNLEFCPEIKSFHFDDFEAEMMTVDGKVTTRYRLRVEFDSRVEFHKISVEKSNANRAQEELFDSHLWRERHVRFKHFSDEDFHYHKQKIFPLLKLSAFLTISRDQYLPPNLVDSAISHVNKFKSGTLLQYLSALTEYSKPSAMLQIYRMYNAGDVVISFEETPFSLDSTWSLRNE
ncbi:hypothetical protein [Pseudomonas synxantha]|uniref:TnsA endonuclease N-terminal domain-containing protein n=1 Tax=Pseudomonas synxantha TaxID=47883 RepID=A0A5D3GC37_9PSED|nr:hypothetical protein [Pseudomonas synxantha]TYK57854.1 hypothetical protein FXO26_11335 [Pseudomonas synxantha]